MGAIAVFVESLFVFSPTIKYVCPLLTLVYSEAKILVGILNFINHARVIKKLELKKEDAVIIQSPDVPVSLFILSKLAEKYNLKIYIASSRDEAKSILHSFPENSTKCTHWSHPVLAGGGKCGLVFL